VLDGGMTAWKAAGGPVTDEATRVIPATFTAELRDGWFVRKDDVRRAVDEPAATCLIDALMPDMYTGKDTPYSRPGHIPGAINVAAVGVVDPDTRLFISGDEIRQRFAPALNDPGQNVITYCGGGIAATADAFLLRRAGKENVAVYDGSMAEWTADESMPLVLGENPR
jgi:thiosulfate/3-mercaptopyruvate sulfurtransferase